MSDIVTCTHTRKSLENATGAEATYSEQAEHLGTNGQGNHEYQRQYPEWPMHKQETSCHHKRYLHHHQHRYQRTMSKQFMSHTPALRFPRRLG